MQGIVTLTMNPAIDKSAVVESVVGERKLRCKAPAYQPGGGGINVSRAIRKLAGESAPPAVALYPSGSAAGQMLQTLLDREGIEHHPVPVEGWTRENLTVREELSGQQFRFGMPGPRLKEAEWQECLNELEKMKPRPDYIVASGSLPAGVPDDFYARVAAVAAELGSKLVVDASGEALRLAAGHGLYLLAPNLREFGELVQDEVKDDSDMEQLATQVVEAGQTEVLVVSLGAGGALLVSREGCERVRAPTVSIQSKVGAGDSMIAGIVLALERGESLRRAVRFGVAAGSAAVMTPGTELCRGEDTERLYAQLISEMP